MTLSNRLISWKLTLTETIAIVSLAVSGVVWANSTFQDKATAAKAEIASDARVARLELEVSIMRRDLTDIAKDTNYIRGRLEPQVSK